MFPADARAAMVAMAGCCFRPFVFAKNASDVVSVFVVGRRISREVRYLGTDGLVESNQGRISNSKARVAPRAQDNKDKAMSTL